MSRVEENASRNEGRDASQDDTQRQTRELVSRTPGKAEGDEKTVDEALENQEQRGDRKQRGERR